LLKLESAVFSVSTDSGIVDKMVMRQTDTGRMYFEKVLEENVTNGKGME